jgi:hypothetical protein
VLGREPFFHNILRKYDSAFGTLFNEVQVERRDLDGNVVQLLDIPLKWAQKEPTLARVYGDPGIDKGGHGAGPLITYERVTMTYDGERALRPSQKHVVEYADEAGYYRHVLNPVPWDLHYNVYVYSRLRKDANQIIEQILPFFKPKFDMTIHLIEDMGVTVDVPVVVGQPTVEDNYDAGYQHLRAVVWTIPFVLKAYLFGPIVRHPVIKFADVRLYNATLHDDILDAVGNTAAIDRVTVQPGQDANGAATSNLEITVPYSDIEEAEEWDYVYRVYGSLVPGDVGRLPGEGDDPI